jgi:hypothetical protein
LVALAHASFDPLVDLMFNPADGASAHPNAPREAVPLFEIIDVVI